MTWLIALTRRSTRRSASPARQRSRRRPLASWSVRARFYEIAIRLLPEGQSPAQVLALLSRELVRLKRVSDAQVIHRVAEDVEDGSALSQAFGAALPDFERNILEIGEKGSSGGLAAAMNEILEARARTARITAVAWAAFFEPLVYVLVLYGFFVMLGIYVVPSLTDLIPKEKWSFYTKLLAAMGAVGTGVYPIAIVFCALAIVISIARSLPRWTGPLRKSAEKYIFVYDIYKQLHGVMWLLGYAVQLKTGVADTDAIAQQVKNASPWLASRLAPVYRAVTQGNPIGDALRNSGFAFPSPLIIEEIASLQHGHAEALENIAKGHLVRLEKRMRRIATIAGFISLFVTFAVFGVVQLAVNGLQANLMGGLNF